MQDHLPRGRLLDLQTDIRVWAADNFLRETERLLARRLQQMQELGLDTETRSQATQELNDLFAQAFAALYKL